MNKNLALKRLDNEDIIWLIYIVIATAAIISNNLERDYINKHDLNAYKKEKIINIIIFSIAILIYLYFFNINKIELKKCKKKSEYNTQLIREIASLLFLIGGIIYLILEIKSVNTEEVGFI